MPDERQPLLSKFRLNSLAVALLGVVCLVMSMQLPLGTAKAPGPGMWPALVSVGLTLVAVFVLVTERDDSDYESLTKRSIVSVLGFAWIAVFVVLFTHLGFTLASIIFSLVWLRFFAKESWRFTLIVAPLFTVAFVVIFSVLLRVPVPHDPVLSFVTGGRF
ncbi:hypothetical protein ACI1US_01189 [Leucobacter sp. BZR 635]